jgi:hypothetical protein
LRPGGGRRESVAPAAVFIAFGERAAIMTTGYEIGFHNRSIDVQLGLIGAETS